MAGCWRRAGCGIWLERAGSASCSALRLARLRFCDGSFGSYLLEHDIGVQDLTFGPGGKASAISGNGLGVEVDEERLERLIRDRITLEGT